MIGQTLAQYTILEKVGEGGMGEVWKARDPSLNREVAIKVLPEAFAHDRERLLRFEREAQLLAALDHPGLATVHGLHEENGMRFLAMELVPGSDLAHRLAGGPLPVQDALEIGVQIAAALEAAHSQGVVHRDLKPSNIMVAPDGKVKVLDFGLAFSTSPEPGSDPAVLSQSPTMVSPATMQGVILGTAAYMSPEQARGKPVDARTDLWAFGCVLYEMFTGHMPFAGETVSDCVAKILTTEPDWDRLPADTPPAVRHLIRRCLTREVHRRQQSAGDARLLLEDVLAGDPAGGAPAVPVNMKAAGRRFPLGLTLGALALGLALGALAFNWIGGPGQADSAALSVVFPADLRVEQVQISPDGSTVAVTGRPHSPSSTEELLDAAYVRSLNDFAFRQVPGSRGVTGLGFSADSQWFLMVAPAEPGATKNFLWKVPVDGHAPPLKLLDWRPDWGGFHWLPDGDVVLTRGSDLLRVHLDGRPPEPPVTITGVDFTPAEFFIQPQQTTRLPGNRHLLSSVESWGDHGYLQNIVVVDLETGEVTTVMENGANPRWSDAGKLLFSRGTALLAVLFDPDRLESQGVPEAVTGDLRIGFQWEHGYFDLAENGRLLYVPGGFVGGDRRLVWVDRTLEEVGEWTSAGYPLEIGPLVSPDGSRFAVVMAGDDGVYDIWISERGRPVLQKWLEEPGRDVVAVAWHPGSESLVYSDRSDRRVVYFQQTIGKESPPRRLFVDASPDTFYSCRGFADDGRSLLFTRRVGGAPQLVAMPMGDGGEGPPTQVLLDRVFDAEVSPDGNWLAYTSDTSDRMEVYLRRWRGNGALGPERRVSTEGGREILWYDPPGSEPLELWFGERGKRVFAVSVGAGEGSVFSEPREIAGMKDTYLDLDDFPDGRVLVRKQGEAEGPPRHVNVIPRWSARANSSR